VGLQACAHGSTDPCVGADPSELFCRLAAWSLRPNVLDSAELRAECRPARQVSSDSHLKSTDPDGSVCKPCKEEK